nr:uncharacterized protein LOC113825568 [Penaeus vannamei]XP_027234212.1 uncharacterized protein LOC113825568 [Penaeus vannamei]
MNRSMYATVVVVVALVLVVGVVVEAAPAGDGRIDEGGVAAFRRSLYGPGRSPERRANNQCSSNARKQYVCELARSKPSPSRCTRSAATASTTPRRGARASSASVLRASEAPRPIRSFNLIFLICTSSFPTHPETKKDMMNLR